MPNMIQIPIVARSNPETSGFARLAYDVVQIDSDNAEISIYDVIASEKSLRYTGNGYKEGNEVTPADFKEQLKDCSAKNITIRMNSRGGDVNSANVIAVAIQDARNDGKRFVCKIDGLCASAAVQIATVCDEVIMHKSALMMIHNPMAFLFGYYNVNEMDSAHNMLSAVKKTILSYYIDKTGLSKEELSAMMDEETWMDGAEAVEKGFADKLMFDEDGDDDEDDDEGEVLDRIKSAINTASFKNIPEPYKVQNNIQTKKGEKKDMPINTVEELIAQYPDFTNQIRQEGINSVNIAEAVQAERARIQAIDELAGKVSNELLNKGKYETFATAEAVAMEAIKTGAFVQTNVLNALEEEGDDTEGVKGLNNEGAKTEEEEKQDEKEEVKNHAEKVALNYLKKMGKVE